MRSSSGVADFGGETLAAHDLENVRRRVRVYLLGRTLSQEVDVMPRDHVGIRDKSQ